MTLEDLYIKLNEELQDLSQPVDILDWLKTAEDHVEEAKKMQGQTFTYLISDQVEDFLGFMHDAISDANYKIRCYEEDHEEQNEKAHREFLSSPQKTGRI